MDNNSNLDKLSSEDLLTIQKIKLQLKVAELELNNLTLKIFLKYNLSYNDSIDEITGKILRNPAVIS